MFLHVPRHDLQEIGLALGGAAGSRLGKCLGYFSCGSTLLNHLERLPLPEFEVPKVLGVDDFAFRKGRQYGTILVNLETHQPIALLSDRKADTLTDWLREHPGVEVFSRDRSTTYKSAMDKAAPEAIQVADRFHLVKNLSDVLEIALGSYRGELKAAQQTQNAVIIADDSEWVVATPKPTATAAAQARAQANHQRLVEQQRTIKALHQKRWLQANIAQEVGVSTRTVQRYLALPDLPETLSQHPTFGKSLLVPYKQRNSSVVELRDYTIECTDGIAPNRKAIKGVCVAFRDISVHYETFKIYPLFTLRLRSHYRKFLISNQNPLHLAKLPISSS